MFNFALILLLSIRYNNVVANSDDNGAAAQQQMLTVLKFIFASASYNGKEIEQDHLIIYEFAQLAIWLQNDILRIYMFVFSVFLLNSLDLY